MIRTTIGIGIIIVGCVLLGVLLSSGLLFPHIIGPVTLIAVGTALLAVRRKAKNE